MRLAAPEPIATQPAKVQATYALLGAGRLNAFRLNYLPRDLTIERMRVVAVTLNGSPLRVRAGSMTVRDVLNDAPNTCAFIVDNATPPTIGGRLRVTVGIPPQATLVFAGRIQKATETYVGRVSASQATKAWRCEAIDDTATADWLRPFGQWANSVASATAIVQYLVANFTPGPLSSAAVQAGLPFISLTLDGTSRLNEALQQICKLIGGYFYWDDGVLHLFVGSEAGLTPDPIDGAPGRFQLYDPPLSYASDDAQIRTRNYGRGHAENTLSALDVAETRIPIADAVMFTSGGGKAIVGTQRFTYTGVVLGGTGALVGPGVTPTAPPVVVPATGAGVTAGPHNYAYTWVTANGSTLPSPIAAITVSTSCPTPVLDSASPGTWQGGVPAGTVITYRLYINRGGLYSYPSADVQIVANGCRPTVTFKTTADMRGAYVEIYRRDNNQSSWIGMGNMYSPTVGMDSPFPVNQAIGIPQTWTDPTVSYGDGGPVGLPTNPGTLMSAQVAVTGIAVGPSGTTARRLYRTVAYGSTLQLLATLNDNATTTYTDATGDGALGAAAPATDTSGLIMGAGQVAVGQTSIPVSSAAWALPGGGWAIVGNGDQIVKYTGISGNALTGVPASGNGAIVAPINFNSTITGAPMLIGITWQPNPNAGLYAIDAGTPVAIWVQRDDTAAQQALAQRYPTGIVEHILVDGRRGEPSLTALCDADLVMYSRPIQTVQYTTLDVKSKSGRPVTVNLPALGVNVSLTIQDVTIDNFGVGPVRFHVTASSLVITLESLLRTMVDGLDFVTE